MAENRRHSQSPDPQEARRPFDPESIIEEASGVSPEERTEILSQIEGLFTRIHPAASQRSAKRFEGARFPLIVNLVALLVLVGGILVVRQIGIHVSSHETSDAGNYLTTEGLVIQSVKQKAAAELSQREARIAAIKQELDHLRANPQAQGTDTALATAREAQLEKELSALQSTADARLTALTVQHEQRSLFLGQLRAVYQNIRDDVSAGDLHAALAGVSSADTLLEKGSKDPSTDISSIAPVLSAGNTVLRAALTSEQSTLKTAQAARDAAGSSRIEMQGQIETLKQKIADLQSNVDQQRATIRDQQARLSDQTSQLAQLRKTAESQRRGSAADSAHIASLERSLAEQRRRMSTEEARVTDLEKTVTDQRRALERRSNELSTLVKTLRSSVDRAASGASADNPTAAPDKVVDLLKTKVAIRAVADSPDARENHPDLYGKLDSFFRQYGASYEAQGRESAANQIRSTLEYLIQSLDLGGNGAADR